MLDDQLAEDRYHAAPMKPHPLVAPAMCLLAGIFLAHWLQPPAAPLLWAAGAGGALLLYLGLRFGRLDWWALSLTALLLGAGLLARAEAWQPPAEHVAGRADGGYHLLVADVWRAPAPARQGSHVVVRARAVDGAGARSLVRLYLPRHVDPPRPGRRIQVRTRLTPFTSMANPGSFDYAARMAEQGLLVRGSASKRRRPEDLGPGQVPWPGRAVEQARAELDGLIGRLPKGEGRALLRALILGQRGEIPADLREAFGGLGVAHLLAISGLHLGLVWGLAYGLLRLLLTVWPALALRAPAPQLAASGAMLPALGYAALAGWSTPTLRALIMAGAVTLALALGRRYRPAGGLALACLIIGVLWPRAPLGLSFQLSFTAVAAILIAAAPLANRWPAKAWPGRAGKVVSGWLLVSGVVGLATWPLAVGAFHQLPVLSLIANPLLVPLVGLLTLPLGLAGAGLGLLWPAGGEALLGLALHPAAWSVALVRALSSPDWAMIYVAGPGPIATLLFYAGAVAALVLRGRWRWAAGTLGLALALAVALWPGPPADGRLTVWVLDVGQGSSAVARLPDGRVMVIDGGGWPGSDFDFGRAVVAPFIWREGLPAPAVLVASHRDADHAGGLAFLAGQFSPAQVWTNGQPADQGAYGRLLAQARRAGSRVLGPAELPREQTLGGAVVRLMWPPREGAPQGASENDRSLWLGLGLGQTWLWLPGDAGPRVERTVAPALPDGGIQVLVAPHHGGRGSLTPELLARLTPRWVIASCGCFNNYRMPWPASLARAAQVGAKIMTTARHGAIKLVSDGRSWQVEPYLKTPRYCGQSAPR